MVSTVAHFFGFSKILPTECIQIGWKLLFSLLPLQAFASSTIFPLAKCDHKGGRFGLIGHDCGLATYCVAVYFFQYP